MSDFDTAIEQIETLKRNYQRICDQHPNSVNRYAFGYQTGYIDALDAAIKLIRSATDMIVVEETQ